MKKIIVLLILILITTGCRKKAQRESTAAGIMIVPMPQKIEMKDGFFNGGKKVVIVNRWNDPAIDKTIDYFREKVSNIAEIVGDTSGNETLPRIIIRRKDDLNLGVEGYRLSVSTKVIHIEINKANGLFYAFQTILQLLPVEVFSDKTFDKIEFKAPCVEIADNPQYKWRGFMLDVSRHFFPKAFIFKTLDYMAMHKLNTFHWHLTDDQGWRIEIKKYPRLTEIGAWRADREDQPWDSKRKPQQPGEKATYGGYYTQDDIREIVQYAADRFITIVPEIEMPGHCTAALAAYPQYSCSGKSLTVPTGSVGQIDKQVYCAGNDGTFEFLQNILSEVVDLFPGEYIHIGGDEAKHDAWKKCPKCQRRMKEENLKNVEELQSYFVKRVEKYINSKNRKLIGWDEIINGGLSENATVMSWRGLDGGIFAARANHDVVFTPYQYLYFDYYQGDPQYEPPAYNKYLPVKKVYSFNPLLTDSLTSSQLEHIIGIQANLWTEYVPTTAQAEYMMFPRMAALCEVAWRDSERRNWSDFSERLGKQFKRYDALSINYSKAAYNVTAKYEVDKKQHDIIVTLENEVGNTQIRYTTEGNEPTVNSNLYTNPFHVDKVLKIKAATFSNNEIVSRVTNLDVLANKATGLPVKVKYPYDERYPSNKEYALTDGVRGSVNYTNGEWQGYFGVDLVAAIDLLKEEPISKVTVSFLESVESGIFFPTEIEIWVSTNGDSFNKISTLKINIPEEDGKIVIKEFVNSFSVIKSRYIKVIAKSIGKCPKEHIYEGAEAFMFVDEIVVE